MRRFVFSLESVRRVREQEEHLIRVELARALSDRIAAADRLEASRKAEREIYTYLRSESHPASELHHISRYMELHRQKIIDADIQLHHTDEAIKRIRVRLHQAHTAREVMDRLKEKQLREHEAEGLRREQAEIDEIATMRHTHAKRELMGAAA